MLLTSPKRALLPFLLVSGTLGAANYPDRYPEPKVIYQDPELIEKTGPLIPLEEKPAAPASSVKAAPRPAVPSKTREEAKTDRRPLETEKATPPVGLFLIVIALAALLFWWSRSQAASSGRARGFISTSPQGEVPEGPSTSGGEEPSEPQASERSEEEGHESD